HDKVMPVCQEVDDFPFGLVAPLQADDTGAGHSTTYPGGRASDGGPGPRSGRVKNTKNARDPIRSRAAKVWRQRCPGSLSSRPPGGRQGDSTAARASWARGGNVRRPTSKRERPTPGCRTAGVGQGTGLGSKAGPSRVGARVRPFGEGRSLR